MNLVLDVDRLLQIIASQIQLMAHVANSTDERQRFGFFTHITRFSALANLSKKRQRNHERVDRIANVIAHIEQYALLFKRKSLNRWRLDALSEGQCAFDDGRCLVESCFLERGIGLRQPTQRSNRTIGIRMAIVDRRFPLLQQHVSRRKLTSLLTQFRCLQKRINTRLPSIGGI